MKKALIICDMFPPAFAPRMGYLCKQLQGTGWQASVVTEHINDQTFTFLTGYADVQYIHYYNASGKIMRRIEWAWIMLLDFLFHYKDKKIARACETLLEANDYEVILCSTYRTFPLPAAQRLARKFNLPLVADLRDIIEQYAGNEYITHKFRTVSWLDRFITKAFRNRLLKDRNQVLKTADCITTVSPWHVSTLKQYNPNVQLIYNGYDPDLFYPEQVTTTRFTITYTGRLLSLSTRNPELLFSAIKKLAAEGLLTPKTCRVVWYTDDESKQIIEREAEQSGVAEFMEYHAYVAASEIPRILNHSSILLSLTNKSDAAGPKGFMTTKFFESLAVEKPILCVRSDESYLAEAIRETNSGLAATNTEEVYDFLLHYYKEWQAKGYTTVAVNRNKLALYSRKEQALQFIRIFEQVLDKRNG